MPTGESQSKFGNFVGRDRELGELRDALDETREGRGQLFLIFGEPGIGKTRLAGEIAREAVVRGVQAVWGRCWEGDGAPAYWPWIQVIRGCIIPAESAQRRTVLESEHASSLVETVAQIVPELRTFVPRPLKPPTTERADTEQARFRLFDSVATLLKEFARPGPLAIILDDLHDADHSSLMMLQFVARGLTGANILIVGTYRDAEVRRSPELSKYIGTLGREARSIPLTGLSKIEVAQFVSLHSAQIPDDDLVSRLHVATAGNPLFVDGIVRILTTDGGEHESASDRPFEIPHTLREAIGRRLAVLSDGANSLLKVAATIGNEFEADVCLQVSGVSRAEFNLLLREASIGGIVEPVGSSRYRFAHALIRGAMYDALDSSSRIRLHGRIAEVIEEIHTQDMHGHETELAYHFRAAGVTEKAIKYSCLAAKAASKVFAHAAAATHWRVAVALSEGQNDMRRAYMLLRLGRVATYNLDPAEGIPRLEEALSLYRELKDEEKVAAANMLLGGALTGSQDFSAETNVPRALEHLRDAQAWWEDSTDLVNLGWFYNHLATALFLSLRIDEAIAALRQARQTWERASDPAWAHAAAFHAQLLVVEGRHREAALLFDEVAAVVHVTRKANPNLFRYTTWVVGCCRSLMGAPFEAKRSFIIGMQAKGLSPIQRGVNFESLAAAELATGNVSQAKAIAAEHRVNSGIRSEIAFREGDWQAALEFGSTMLEWARRCGRRWEEAYTLSGLFGLVRITGDFPRAAEFLRQALSANEPSAALLEMRIRPAAALLALEMGRPDDANQHLEVCRAILAKGEDWVGMVGSVEFAEGMLAAGQGRDFAIHFEQAMATFEQYSLPWDQADTLLGWGIALNGVDESSEANKKFDAAIEIYQRHGAGQRWIDRVEAARHSSAPAPKAPETTAVSTGPAVFRREGEFWTIAYREATFRLRHVKGFAYMAVLLAHPGQRFHVKELVAMVEGANNAKNTGATLADDDLTVTNDLGGADPALDSRAFDDYRRRLKDLEAQLDEAERFNDLGRAARAREELDLLKAELASGIGIDGHARQGGSHAERARVMVGRNIRAALEKIRRANPVLGRHFAASISMGYFCSYQPKSERPTSWQIEAE